MNDMDEGGFEDEAETTDIVPIAAGDPLVDRQVTTAKRFPRSIAKFRKEAEALALLDEQTAGECLYALPRGGKVIEGPSVRLAEILVYAWGNARAQAQVIDEGPTHLTAEGMFFDPERNIAIVKRVRRRITNSRGQRYNDDMIGTTGNAANSIAYRNAVFAAIPKALWKGIYEKARLASLGKGGTLTQQRQNALDWFGKLGVKPEQLFDLLSVQGIEDIGEDHLVTMRGLRNSIQDGETKVEDLFAKPETGGPGAVDEKLKAKNGTTPAPGAPGNDRDIARRARAKKADQDKAAESQGADPGIANLHLLQDLAQERGVDPEKWDAEVVKVAGGAGTPEEKRETLNLWLDSAAPIAAGPALKLE